MLHRVFFCTTFIYWGRRRNLRHWINYAVLPLSIFFPLVFLFSTIRFQIGNLDSFIHYAKIYCLPGTPLEECGAGFAGTIFSRALRALPSVASIPLIIWYMVYGRETPDGSATFWFSKTTKEDFCSTELTVNEILARQVQEEAVLIFIGYVNIGVFAALLFASIGAPVSSSISSVSSAVGVALLVSGFLWISSFKVIRAGSVGSVAFALILLDFTVCAVLMFHLTHPSPVSTVNVIAIVVSMSFIALPLSARFVPALLISRLGLALFCAGATLSLPEASVNPIQLFAILMVSTLLMLIIGYWIIENRSKEIKLRLDLNELNDQISRNSSQLSLLNEGLVSQKNKAESEHDLRRKLISFVGHDLRQPISALGLIHAELLKREHSPEGRDLLLESRRCIQSAGQLIENILQIGLDEQARIGMNSEATELHLLFDSVKEETAALAREMGVEVRTVPTSVTDSVDGELFSRILRNLVENALRHSGADKVIIGVRRRPENCEAWIADNGYGFGEREGQNAQTNTAENGSAGLGLGLNIAHQLADACEATLTISSHSERGTLCRLGLPSPVDIRRDE